MQGCLSPGSQLWATELTLAETDSKGNVGGEARELTELPERKAEKAGLKKKGTRLQARGRAQVTQKTDLERLCDHGYWDGGLYH